jgi:hypothetical protein
MTVQSLNLDHLRSWVTELREGDRLQVKGGLAKFTSDNDGTTKVGYCCLGVGCEVAGVDKYQFQFEDPDENDEDADAYSYGTGGMTELAPPEFLTWLGFTVDDNHAGNGYDLRLDYVPDDLADVSVQGTEEQHAKWTERVAEYERPYSDYADPLFPLTLAGLNDSGFTFAQIADCIDYFGITQT